MGFFLKLCTIVGKVNDLNNLMYKIGWWKTLLFGIIEFNVILIFYCMAIVKKVIKMSNCSIKIWKRKLIVLVSKNRNRLKVFVSINLRDLSWINLTVNQSSYVRMKCRLYWYTCFVEDISHFVFDSTQELISALSFECLFITVNNAMVFFCDSSVFDQL